MKYSVLFIALLFAGCDEGSSTEEAPSADGGYETFTIAGETMQVAKEDFPEEMHWDQAMSVCEGLGNGWRLPNESELKAMYEQLHKQGKGNFKDEFYWSSSQYGSDQSDQALMMNFGTGDDDDYGFKKLNVQVRAVRPLP
jgi:uncharacterized protein (TIGR02145 family)